MDQLFKKKSFLIVDDISAMRSVTKTLLCNLGAEQIHQASNGAAALKLLGQEHIDVILSDWSMPVMNGMELLKAMRAETRWKHIPLLLITGEADRDRIRQAIDSGVAGILVKPYSGASLEQRLMRIFGVGTALPTIAPATSSVPSPAPASGTGSTTPAQANILIVDDLPDNLELLSGILKDDFRVRVANNGKRALALCQSDNPPDLVLLDIMMPEMDGFEVARRLREHPTSEQIPVIFVTAMTDDAARTKGLGLGAVDFVTKPIDPEGLKIRIRNFMRYIDLRRQLQANYDSMLENTRLKESVENITKHDIKGPLAGVLGLAQALATSPGLTAEQREQIRSIEDATVGVLDTITRSTELYRIESGAFHLQPQKVVIVALLKQQIDLIRASFAAKGIELELTMAAVGALDEAHLAISGDPMLCRSIFQNLLKNACEAAPENSKITVLIHGQSPVRIVISNTGAVPASLRARFFDKFATAGKEGGNGLGTYSAKLMVQAQGGTLEMTCSDETNSTQVSVMLPSG